LFVASRPDTALSRATALGDAAAGALRRPANWVQLAKFCTVGLSGYVVNLSIYAALLAAGLHYLPAACCSFLVAVTNNYTWNRLWTFRHQRGHVAIQGLRFFVVSAVALCANLLFLSTLVAFGVPKLTAQAIAIANKLWSFRRRPAA
jgi:dolichol-phosphate mannosyltransferase